jgi:GDP-4-dehydro-6-deoxy-D-mannose reductase
LIGSAAEYGLVKEEDNPVKEDQPLNPVSIYGLTKAYQTHLMKFYCQVHNLDVVMVRPFNLLGQSISTKLFIGRIYQQIKQYKKGEIQHIALGDLSSKRDYIDIVDAIKYYEIAINKSKPGGIHNVGRGFSITLSELLEQILLAEDLDLGIIKIIPRNVSNKLDISNIFADISNINSLTRSQNF